VDLAHTLNESELVEGGAVWKGIDYALNSDVVRKHVPEWQALSQHKLDLFQAICGEWMMWHTGEAAFLEFMEAYKEEDPEKMQHAGEILFKRIRTKAQNFVLSLFQLDILGRGTVRTRKGRAAEQLSSVDALGDLLTKEKKDMEAMANQLMNLAAHRLQRPASQGPSGIPGHSISAIRAQLQAAEIARQAPDLGPAFEKLATGLTRDYLLATMIRIYVAKMSEQGKKLNKDYSYEDAEKYAREVLGLTGDQAAAEHQQEEEQSYAKLKIEFFRDMERAWNNWRSEEQGIEEIEHAQGPAGEMAIKLVSQITQAIENDQESMSDRMLKMIKKQLEDVEQLDKLARASGTDPLMTRIALEYVLYHFGLAEAPEGMGAAPAQPQQQPQHAGQLSATQAGVYLQQYLHELLGGSPPPVGHVPVPESTIALLMKPEMRAVYEELRGYAYPRGEKPMMRDIDLTKHPRFLEVCKAIIDAVDQRMVAQSRQGGRQQSL
jgi:LPS sulfotransferase NodH